MRTTLNVALIAAAAAVAGCGGGVPCEVLIGDPVWDSVGDSHREMPDLDMVVGDRTEIPLGDYHFLPPGCVEGYREWGEPIFEASSSDPAVVAVSIADDLTTLAVAAVAVADSVRVAVQAIGLGAKPEGVYEGFNEFLVRVRPPPPRWALRGCPECPAGMTAARGGVRSELESVTGIV